MFERGYLAAAITGLLVLCFLPGQASSVGSGTPIVLESEAVAMESEAVAMESEAVAMESGPSVVEESRSPVAVESGPSVAAESGPSIAMATASSRAHESGEQSVAGRVPGDPSSPEVVAHVPGKGTEASHEEPKKRKSTGSHPTSTPAKKATPKTAPKATEAHHTPSLIVLLTDFGTRGYLLGSLKGSIYKAFPEARIDSLTHDIKKFDIDEAAQTLVLSTADFPPGTVFVVVVDPGVGRPRTPIALETENGQIYIAPDNGVLTQVAIRYRIKKLYEITNPDVARVDARESTYMSRDVMGPAAAALAKGMPISELGPELKSLYLLTSSPATIRDNQVFGTVRLIDAYGNVHTNINADQLAQIGIKKGDEVQVVIGERHFKVKRVQTYGDVNQGEPLALVGSHDEMQLAINQGNLAASMNIQKGEPVVLSRP